MHTYIRIAHQCINVCTSTWPGLKEFSDESREYEITGTMVHDGNVDDINTAKGSMEQLQVFPSFVN